MISEAKRNARVYQAGLLKAVGGMVAALCGLCTFICGAPALWFHDNLGALIIGGAALWIGGLPALLGLIAFGAGLLLERAYRRAGDPGASPDA